MLLTFDRIHDHLEEVYCLNLLPAKRVMENRRVHKFFQCALLPARPIILKEKILDPRPPGFIIQNTILEARPPGFRVENKLALSVRVRRYRLGPGRGRAYKLYIAENTKPVKVVVVFNLRGIDRALRQWEMEHYDAEDRRTRATRLEKARAKRDKEEAELLKRMRERVLFSP